MTSWIVIDGGVFFSAAVQEPHSQQANELLLWVQAQRLKMAAPALCLYEMASTVRKTVHRQVITVEFGAALLDQLMKHPIFFMYDFPLVRRAYELSTQHGLPSAYDGQAISCAGRTSELRLLDI